MMKEKILTGKTSLGIELGSTRIKAALIDDNFEVIATGSHDWENSFLDGYWTYSLDSIHNGVQDCFKSLAKDVLDKYGITLTTVGAIGVSAMMHGYLAFDKDDNLLVPFRTWRNTKTEAASAELSKLFNFSIPQRWSIAHLYQAILNNEPHTEKIANITTLAGYIHYLLTGCRELGVGDASGMFPIDGEGYDKDLLDKFRGLIADKGYSWDIEKILPQVKPAGAMGAQLTADGAKFLDVTGNLEAGIPVCPPEGDAGTGMVATNAVKPKTGNISAGTSIFSMLVLEKPLSGLYPEIDIVTTPAGAPVAMVHCNNCCAELDAWVNIFGEFAALAGIEMDKSKLYELLYTNAKNGECDGGIVAYNYLSGEHVTQVSVGRPMYFRLPDAKMNLAGFMKAQLFSAVSSLKIGMDILFDKEKVNADKFLAHGGLFKVSGVAQQILANATNTPISVMETAAEGGAWGMALLAEFMRSGADKALGEWMEDVVFADAKTQTLQPDKKGTEEFSAYIKNYKEGLAAEKCLASVE